LNNVDLTVGSRIGALVVVRAVATVRPAIVRVHLSLAVVKWSSVLGKNALVLALTANVDGGKLRERVDLRLNDGHRFN
jgi:hypothetical protein